MATLQIQSKATWDSRCKELFEGLHPYQREYLADRSQQKIWVASRRIGKSFLIAIEAFFYAVDNPGEHCLLVAHNQESSNNLMRYVKGLARWMCMAPDAPAKIGDIDRAGSVSLTNGAIIVAIAGGNPAAILSWGGSVWLDEFAFHRDQNRNYHNADPVTAQSGGVLRITSTPFSDADLFWKIYTNFENEYQDWKRYETTMEEAIADGLKTRKRDEGGEFIPIDLRRLRAGMPNQDEYNAAYCCQPLSDASSCWPWETLNRMRAKTPLTGGSLYGGFDVARVANGDFAALGECIRDGEQYGWPKTTWAERGVDFQSMQDGVVRAFEDNGWVRMSIDGNGIGMETSERLQKRLGSARVDVCKMTPGDKSDMVTTAQHIANEGRLWVDDDRDLLMDLHALKRIVTDSNNIRYDADRNEKGHSDRAWAALLAMRAAGTQPPKSKHSPTAIRRRKPAERMY